MQVGKSGAIGHAGHQCFVFACIVLACFVTGVSHGQDFSQYYVEPAEPIQEYEFEIPSKIPTHKLQKIDGAAPEQSDLKSIVLDPRYRVYRAGESITSYLPGDGEQFGWLDFENNPYISHMQNSGITVGASLHLLSGPNSVPLPPRLWDFSLGYQRRDTLGERFSYDVASSIGVYSDFEDSAREGVRPLGHAVGSMHQSDRWDWVLGVDYVNRDDYKLLPVMGFSWHNPTGLGWSFDVVFPRPRIHYAFSDSSRFYVAGLLGGGTWDIELPQDVNDVMNYRDYRILFGHEQITPGGHIAGTELGWVFNRQLDMRHSLQQVEFDDAFIIRFVARR